jgi:hypothetical protein
LLRRPPRHGPGRLTTGGVAGANWLTPAGGGGTGPPGAPQQGGGGQQGGALATVAFLWQQAQPAVSSAAAQSRPAPNERIDISSLL